MAPYWILGVLAAAAVVLILARGPAGHILRLLTSASGRGHKALLEDALKHVLARKHQASSATPESLAGALGLSARGALELILKMEAANLVASTAGALRLTEEGEQRALQIVRAHRLWETYLAFEARMPLSKLHAAAERAEHRLSPEGLDALEAMLGHPVHDPHGDPIPSASGALDRLEGTPLTDWPAGSPGQIVHVEDEPAAIFRRIPSHLLHPGVVVKVAESGPQGIRLLAGEADILLAPAVAANIQVAPAARESAEADLVPLSSLSMGEEGELVRIDESLQGLSRRRLLDLGLTPGVRIGSHLDNLFGDPRAFRLRGTTVALRAEQAAKIWVRKAAAKRTVMGAA